MNIKGIEQYDSNDCGPACLATIAKYYDKNITISKIREVAGTTINSTNIYGIIQAGKKFGFDGRAVKTDSKEDILSDFPKPAIAHIINEEGLLHFIVIYSVNKKTVKIFDPDGGIKKLKYEEFIEQWTGVLVFLVPNEKFEDVKSDEKITYFSLLKLLKRDKAAISITVIASLILTVLGIISALYIRFIIDDVLTNKSFSQLHTISIAMIIIGIVQIVISFFKSKLSIILSEKLIVHYTTDFFEHLINLPINFFKNRKTGEILNRFSDLSTVISTLLNSTLTVIIESSMMVIGAGILYMQSKELFLLTIIPLILYAILVYAFKNALKSRSREILQSTDKYNSNLLESIKGVELIKLSNLEENFTDKILDDNTDVSLKSIKLFNIGNVQSLLVGILKIIYSVGVIWIGAYMVMKGNLTLGILMSFISLNAYFISPIENLINLQPEIHKSIASLNRVIDVILIDEEIDRSKKLINIDSIEDIELNNVHFKYGNTKILNGINMKVDNFRKVALVGRSGEGKSTVAKLLTKLNNANEGQIKINSININDIYFESVRNNIVYVDQEPFFFTGTIYEALTMNNPEINLDDVIYLCKEFDLYDKISKLPLGFQSSLSEGATNLSGGEKQRLNIIRALLRKPKVLILDEVTANIDWESEEKIIKYITNKLKECTVIMITHNLRLLKNLDEIFVLENGMIVESGSHKDLILRKESYYKMFQYSLSDSMEVV
ncbi:MAG: peptidase domain-containing ABC transporter [Clostridium sp.]